MAKVYFYDATELDKEQLAKSLDGTDHQLDFVSEKISDENLHDDAEVISVFVSSTITREIIEAMPKLKLIALRSTGFNNVDFEAANEKGITVTNVPTYGNETVAEFAFTMLLAITRKLEKVIAAENTQYTPDELTGTDLHGKTIGVVGTGNIGQKSIKIANGFSMNVIAYDAFPKEELQEELDFKYVELDELIAQSDVITLHVPLLPSTNHLINREKLQAMKPGAILVNTARGELVETHALIEYLDNGHLGGACIDVIEGEKLLNRREEIDYLLSKFNSRGTMKHSVEISILKAMPNVIISPHNAYNTIEAIGRINATTGKNIIDYWQGESPNKVVPPPKPRGKLLLVRHGESRWNATGQWTGMTDIPLDDKGFSESSKLGRLLEELEIPIDYAYYTELIRSRETLEGMFNAAQMFEVPLEEVAAFNERDYGIYTGKNKWEVKEEIGDEAFQKLRRGFDVEVPEGETLKMVYERAVPFYLDNVLPRLLKGDNILISAHGNSIRSLIKYLEDISDEDISKVEMIFGQIIQFEVDDDGRSTEKIIHKIDTEPQDA